MRSSCILEQFLNVAILFKEKTIDLIFKNTLSVMVDKIRAFSLKDKRR